MIGPHNKLQLLYLDFSGDPLQRLSEDKAVHDGHGPIRWMFPECWNGGSGPFSAQQCHNRNQTLQQHVHVPS